jgi:hypothetical protein
MDQPVYDYIFSGFGLAAYLSLDAMLEIGCLEGKQILIIDSPEPPEEKPGVIGNEVKACTTCCFWLRKKAGLYRPTNKPSACDLNSFTKAFRLLHCEITWLRKSASTTTFQSLLKT